MVGLNRIVFRAVDGGNWHRATGCGEVDVSGALTPCGRGAACKGVCNQGAVFIVDVAHAGFFSGGGGACDGAPEALKKGCEGSEHR